MKLLTIDNIDNVENSNVSGGGMIIIIEVLLMKILVIVMFNMIINIDSDNHTS